MAQEATVEPSAKEVIPLDVRVCIDERAKGKMEPERGALKSSSAGTGPEAPGASVKLGDATNDCRRLFARRRQFGSEKYHFFP